MSRGLELRLFCLRFGVQDFGTHPSSPAQLLCFEDLSSDGALSSSAVSNDIYFHFRPRVSIIAFLEATAANETENESNHAGKDVILTQ